MKLRRASYLKNYVFLFSVETAELFRVALHEVTTLISRCCYVCCATEQNVLVLYYVLQDKRPGSVAWPLPSNFRKMVPSRDGTMPHTCCIKRRFMKFHVCAVVVSTRDGTMYTHFAKNLKFIYILFWAREVPMLKFHNAKWIMQMIEFQWCKTLILMIHALVLAWYVEFFDIAWILQSGHELPLVRAPTTGPWTSQK